MAIDLRSLKYFCFMADRGSISRAAEALHVAQPALTAQLKMMEAELGVELFQRNARGIALTESGARFLVHARDILERVRLAHEHVKQGAAEPTGHVGLALPQSMGSALTLPLVSQCRERWPKIHLQVMEVASGDVQLSLARRSTDLGIVYVKPSTRELRFIELVSEELVLVAPPRRFAAFSVGKLASAKKVPLAELAELPLVLPAVTNGLRQLVDTQAGIAGIKLRTIADVDAISQIVEIVSQKHGYSVLSYPSVVSALEAGKISVARLVDPRIIRTAYLCCLSELPLSQAAACVESLLVEIVGDLIDLRHWPGHRGLK